MAHDARPLIFGALADAFGALGRAVQGQSADSALLYARLGSEDALSPDFVRHYHLLGMYLAGIRTLKAHGFIFEPGVKEQHAALVGLALSELDLLTMLAASDVERQWIESAKELRLELAAECSSS